MNPNNSKKIFIGLRVRLLIGFSVFFTLAFALTFYWFYTYSSEAALRRIQDDLRSTLVGASEGINTENFVALAQEGKRREDGLSDDPRYWEHVRWLAQVNEIEPRAFVYTYVHGKAENEIVYIGSSGAVLTPPQGAKFLTPKISKGPLLQGLSQTIFKNNFEAYQDEYGKWVTGYTPIKNAKGEIVGGMGIDFQADYVFEVQQNIRERIAIAFLIVFVILLAAVWFISYTITRPIRQLTQVAEKIGEGDYNQNLAELSNTRFPNEIGTLAQVFEIMVSKVYNREKALRTEIEHLKIEIDENKRSKQVSEIVETDFFKDLISKAGEMRERRLNNATKPA
jgi:methyl-accepting chemotaxis protein